MERNNRPGSPALRKPVGAVHRQETVSGRNGFVKYHVHAEMIRGDIDRLCAAGVIDKNRSVSVINLLNILRVAIKSLLSILDISH